MNNLRDLIQSKLNGITTIDSGVPIPDDIVEKGKTYFGYELQEDNVDSDCDSNYTMQITLTGRIVRKNLSTENTLLEIDKALNEIKKVLKGLKLHYNYQDITLSEETRKILVTATGKYNEINIKEGE